MQPRFFVSAEGSARPGEAQRAGADLETRPTPPDRVGSEVVLSAADAHHARGVLRARPGERCEIVFQPEGRLFGAVFVEVGPRVVVRLDEELAAVSPERAVIALVQALPAPRKVDEIVEKGTEVGIVHFVIVPAEGSPRGGGEKLQARLDRWERIAGEAAKQSRQVGVPTVQAAASLEAAASLSQAAGYRSLVLTPASGAHLGDVVGGWSDDEDGRVRVALWVGPEGGWGQRELERFAELGLPTAGLGRRILRVETAGPVAAAVARFALGDR